MENVGISLVCYLFVVLSSASIKASLIPVELQTLKWVNAISISGHTVTIVEAEDYN